MDLDDWKDMIIGREVEGEGLPKHARKRVTIAVQLVTMPRVLFCDEPSTGLGTTEANLVMQAIRRCTDEMGLITVATIHQPSKLIWDAFDDLLLLAKGGKLVYMGEMGTDSQQVIEYFSNVSGQKTTGKANPADFVLGAVESVSVDDAVTSFEKSSERTTLSDAINASNKEENKAQSDSIAKIRDEAKRGNSKFEEFGLLVKRHFLTEWRNPSYSFMRLLLSAGMSIFMGILFNGDKTTIEGAVFSIGALFFLVFVLVIPMQVSG